MKKILSILFVLCVLAGCHKTNDYVSITRFEFPLYINENRADYEIVNVDDDYININELDRSKDQFLFTTVSILTLDLEGNFVNQYFPSTEKRIVDFAQNKDIPYYLTLIHMDEKYGVELCTIENNQEKIIKTYNIDDPYMYPRFINYKDDLYFLINNVLYCVNQDITPIDFKEQVFFEKNTNNKEKLYFKTITESGYQLYYYENGEFVKTKFEHNFGYFILIENQMIYEDLNDNHLYSLDLNTFETECIFDLEQISDFAIINENKVCISTNNRIYYLNLKNNKVEYSFDKKGTEVEHIMNWIHTNGKDNVYFSDFENIFKIHKN